MRASTIDRKTAELETALAASGWVKNRYGHWNRELTMTYKSKATQEQVSRSRMVSLRIRKIVIQLYVMTEPNARLSIPEMWYKMSTAFLRDCDVKLNGDGTLSAIKIGTWLIDNRGMIKA